MSVGSTFLIDTSKKVAISRKLDDSSTKEIDLSKDDEVKIEGLTLCEALLRGDMDTKVLSNIGFSYKEEFQGAGSIIDQKFEQLAKPITGILKTTAESLFTKIGSKLDDETSLRDIIINAGVTYQYLKNVGNVTDPHNDALTDDLVELLNEFNKVSLYNVPYRKKMPTVNLTKDSNFKVTFAYGKCNMFNAKEEVWKPLTALKGFFFPEYSTGTDVDKYGLTSLIGTSASEVPYTQQAYSDIAKGLRTIATKEPDNPNNSLSSHVTNVIKSSSAVKAASDDKDKFITAAGDDAADVSQLKSAVTKARKVAGVSNPKVTTNDKNAIMSAFAEVQDQVITSLPDGKDTDAFKSYSFKKKESSSSSDTIENVLKNIANFEVKVKGGALQSIFRSVSKSAFYLYFGYVPSYVTSQEELNKFCYNTAHAKIMYGPFLVSGVDIKFDMSHVDMNGYPLAGYLEFKNVWPLLSLGQCLKFKSPDDGKWEGAVFKDPADAANPSS